MIEPKWKIVSKELKSKHYYIFGHINSSTTYIGSLHNTDKININDILNYLNDNHPNPHPEKPIEGLEYTKIYIHESTNHDCIKLEVHIYKSSLINIITPYLRKKKIEEVLKVIQ